MSTQIVRIEHDGQNYELVRGDDGVPRVEDLKLAAWVDLAQPRDIRKLIARHVSSLGQVCATVAQTTGKGGRPSRAYWLTEEQALFIVTRCETPRGLALTKIMVAVFAKALRGEPDALATPTDPLDLVELLLKSQRAHQARLAQVEQQQAQIAATQARQETQLALITQQQKAAVSETLELPAHAEVPEITNRVRANKIVRAYCIAFGQDHQVVWKMVYGKLKDHYSVDLYARSLKRRGVSKLDIVESDRLWPQLFAVLERYCVEPMNKLQAGSPSRPAA